MLAIGGNEEAARLAGAEGQVEIESRRLGMGSVQIQAVAEYGDGAAERAMSRPLTLEIAAPKVRAPVKRPDSPDRIRARWRCRTAW